MSFRFPAEAADTETAIDVVQQAMSIMHQGPAPFKWIDDDSKTLLGCFAPFSYTPEMCRQFFVCGKLAYGIQGVKPRNRELALIGLCSVVDAPFVVYSHRAIAIKIGISDEQFEDGIAGRIPEKLSDEERAAYRLGCVCAALTGRLDDATWDEFSTKLDKTEIVGLLHVIGGYRWVSLLEQVNGDYRKFS
ncbi:hypothetical protein F4818DRAFT_438806 [Hypoxylon cercidicola]|nr:hypothetical protein F4818DRAFT_438806 [Hypoxylon cercidicola]